MSTCPIYQKRGDQLVPVLVIDEAPSSDPSAAGHLVDSNGIASVVQELREEISELQPDVPTIVESVDSITEEDHDGFYWAFDETGAHRVPESNANFPVGSIVYTAMKAAPHGFLICDGSEVGRTTYPDLFTAIGTTYGAGDGTTTFNLPNLMNKTVWGGGLSAVGGEKAAGLPNITGYFALSNNNYFFNQNETYTGGAIFKGPNTVSNGANYSADVVGAAHNVLNLDASYSNPIYGNSDTVQPPALVLLPCIKAFEAVVNGGMVDVGELIKSIDALKDVAGGSSNEITNIVQNLGNYLPLAGGTMTGPITGNYAGTQPAFFKADNDNQRLWFAKVGTNHYQNTPSIVIDGAGYNGAGNSMYGGIALNAGNDTQHSEFVISPSDGAAVSSNNSIAVLKPGYYTKNTDPSCSFIIGPQSSKEYTVDTSSDKVVSIDYIWTSDSHYPHINLTGKLTGKTNKGRTAFCFEDLEQSDTEVWNQVVSRLGSTMRDGTYGRGGNCIRYSDGLQLAGGSGLYNNGDWVGFTLPFIHVTYACSNANATITNWTSNGFMFDLFGANNVYVSWIAYGYWK